MFQSDYQTKLDQIINLMVERGDDGVFNYELSKIALNYTGFMSTLSRQGFVYDTIQIGASKTYKYILRKRPSQIKIHPSAYDEFVLTFYDKFGGKLEGENEVKEILQMCGANITRKHGYYKSIMNAELQMYNDFDEQMQLDL